MSFLLGRPIFRGSVKLRGGILFLGGGSGRDREVGFFFVAFWKMLMRNFWFAGLKHMVYNSYYSYYDMFF